MKPKKIISHVEAFPKARFLAFCSQLKILSKDFGLVPFKLLGTQSYILDEICSGLEEGISTFCILKARQLGACLDPNTPVLRADYTWCRIADVSVGDELVAVDEFPLKKGKGGSRKMRTTTVEAKKTVFERAFKIQFDDGRSVICTGNHRWLVRNSQDGWRWRTIDSERKYDRIQIGHKVRWITKPWENGNFDDGWFGGILDGEGSISNKNRSGASLCAAQLPGAVWNKMVSYASLKNYNYRVESDATERKTKYGKRPVPKLVFTRMDEIFRVIGQCRPARFLTKRFWEEKELPGKGGDALGYATITNIIPLAEMEMVDLQTTHKTYIANGFVSHNSTFFLALDLFWAFEHSGLSGALATHTEALRDQFRAMIEVYLSHLPKGYKVGYSRHNRTMLIMKNTSMFSYLVAGTKETSKNGLGRGGAYNFLHASEVAFWGSPDDIANLRSALSTHYAHRLQIYESTANGFNHFADMCESAQDSPSQKFIFVGWWRNELYRYEKEHPYFDMYWDGRLSVMEKKRVAEVKKQYNYDITPEQMAWVRWKLNDEFGGDQSAFDQEFPWLATDAFVATGSKFFSNESLTDAMRMAHRVMFKPYRYALSQNWSDTGVVNVKDNRAELRIWQDAEPNGYYSIGCDPAYGSSDKNDRTVITVLRCYADRAVQVAEYCSPSISTYQCAWVLAHLAGYYRNCKVNLEITGPGTAVFEQLLSLQREIATMPKGDESAEIRNCLGNIQHYLYRRPDSMSGNMAMQWRTTRDTKTVAMNTFKDMVELRRCTILSLPCLEEMKSITVDDGVIEAKGSGKDDRVMAAALACIAWRQQVQQRMQSEGLTYQEVHNREEKGPVPKIQKRTLDYLKANHIRIG